MLQLASDDETRDLQRSIRQTVAVFFSGRLHEGFEIRKVSRLKYEGRILEGAQVLIGESMLQATNGSHECTSYYDFCQRIATDEDFRQCLSPLIDFLSDLQEVDYTKVSDIDFRWAKLIIFAKFLKRLIKQIDSSNVIKLLPELEAYEQTDMVSALKNIADFEEAYS